MNRLTSAPLIILLAVSAAACSDRNPVSPDLSLPTDFVVSNARLVTASLSGARGTASISAQGIVYVSLPPYTLPNGATVQIQDQANGVLIRVPLIHGGFDPVPIAAAEGDVLKLTVVDPNGVKVSRTIRVPVRRPPTIVRSDPGKGRTDVALSVSLTVVFSEPVDATTAAQSIYLLHEGNRVSGAVRFPDNSWTAKFVPDRPFDAQSTYELVVTPDVRDLDGDVLGGSYSASFVTGTEQESGCPGYAIPSDCPPFPTGGSGVITGVVSERSVDGLKPLAGATAFAWVQLGFPNGGYSRGGTQTDAAGRFTLNLLPRATIMLQGWADGYSQPCAEVVEFDGTTATRNIELVSRAHPLIEAATKPPIIKGVVYEVTPTGTQPVAGAMIFIDLFDDLIAATTTTDENGRYAVCQIPDFGFGQGVYAVKNGYQDSYQHVSVGGTTELQLDIELKR